MRVLFSQEIRRTFFIALRKMTSSVKWNMKGVLLDITGVLYESGQKIAIPGSVEAIQRLYSLKVPFRFVTNETQRTRASLVSKLRSFGFTLSESDVFSPGVAASHYVKQMQLRPFLLVHPNILPEFSDCNQSNPNCVVVGDAAEHFSFENMNKAFNILIKSKNPVLISMGKGRYYKENDELVMDLGGFTAALEYATGAEAKIIGKPSPEFFTDALKDMGVNPKEPFSMRFYKFFEFSHFHIIFSLNSSEDDGDTYKL
ncbi:phospholysine phosphohistidine inorganic pyrophosphate phosphatase-like isoform X3 [Stegodyphus dumicola]|uniref:phospholysine phosphohistidine inorganic pyrophosphate phosphatase-like isoform X3 n=1 Tax=Stegodyphus dumicola TaxID=202533 RepID=UPI0015A96E4F|nr:phospholysine phosphohistidine inorganic pyrophosphate phosphatase-like isoform X3 [Stegodyphus dumicola]